MTHSVLDNTRQWPSITNVFPKTLKWKDVSAPTNTWNKAYINDKMVNYVSYEFYYKFYWAKKSQNQSLYKNVYKQL